MIKKAISYYKTYGGIPLLEAGFKFSQRQALKPISKKIVDSTYNEKAINSNELKQNYSSRTFYLDENLSDLGPKINEEIAPLKEKESLEYNYYPMFSFKEPFVAEVPDIIIAGPDAVAITNDGRYLLDPINSIIQSASGRLGRAVKRAIETHPVNVGIRHLYGNCPRYENVEPVAAILHSRWNNYYHWMLEHLLKLRGIKRYEQKTGNSVTLIVPPDSKQFITESLRLLGYSNSDYINWNQNALKVEKLIVPSYPELTPETIEWLRRNMIEKTNLSNKCIDHDWIYVSRQRENKRKVINYDEVKPILRKYDVTPIFCEDISLEEEIILFNNADGVIGPHGAGLTAAVWGENINLLEIFNSVVKAPYYVLAHVLDHDYHAISADPIGHNPNSRNQNMILDIEKLESYLARHR